MPSKIKKNIFKRVFSTFFIFSLVAFCVSAVLLVPYAWHLNKTIKSKFDGRRWAIPARVYARPLELYSGKKIDKFSLEKELRFAGYRQDVSLQHSGSFYIKDSSFQLVTREFDFGDGIEPSKSISVTFSGDTIADIEEQNSYKSLDIVRIDPAFIGSFLPQVNEDRLLLKREDLPEVFVSTLLGVEDRNFYSHHGLNIRGILRAVLVNLRSRQALQGGSSLTQQLVKNFFLSNERTYWRKLNEAIMAILLDWQYDKDEILTAYANEIFLGQDGGRAIHGFGLASQFYFKRDLSDLDIDQIALLVGMIKGPSYYNPRKYPQRCIKRRQSVLEIMRELNIIDEQEFLFASTEPLMDTEKNLTGFNRFPEFLELVRRQLHRDYREEDLTSNGLKIFTTLDPEVQWKAEDNLASHISRIERKRNLEGLEGAVVVTNRNNGEIEAVVGSRFPRGGGFNRALDAKRPIGSLIKPAVYLAALENNYTLTDMLDDTALVWENHDGSHWVPQNFDKIEHGAVPMYGALIHSYNLATVKLGISVGIEKVVNVLRRLGFEKDTEPYPSLLLGAIAMSPLQVSQIYQTFAGEGFYTKLRSIVRVLDNEHRPLKRFPLAVEQCVENKYIFLINSTLQKVVQVGTAKSLSDYIPTSYNIAGKTGTSDDSRDSWFAGFSDDKLAVVWIGRDDNTPINLSGSRGALQVWGNMMSQLHIRPLRLSEPPDIKWVRVPLYKQQHDDPKSGLMISLPFIRGSAYITKDEVSDGQKKVQGEVESKNIIEKFFDWLF